MSDLEETIRSLQSAVDKLSEASVFGHSAITKTAAASEKSARLGANGMVVDLSVAKADVDQLLVDISGIASTVERLRDQAAAVTDG